ncbi:SURF1 family cytochrome oxidase biogenesis protein, partial [Bordetella petrii]|uniref:SURF1 family cytochrome oxidase biogenesis protein n=1 Tax=Bordetella petrii TaxID=94624 RepID=UPI002E75C04F
GPQSVAGELALRVPRLFELWSLGGARQGQLPATLPVAGGAPPQVQNLDLPAYGQATGLVLLPAVLMQARGSDALVRDWPQPSVDYNQNQGYALQWFSFAAIAALAWLAVAWRAWRRHRQAG